MVVLGRFEWSKVGKTQGFLSTFTPMDESVGRQEEEGILGGQIRGGGCKL
jgi:hypothetical protein